MVWQRNAAQSRGRKAALSKCEERGGLCTECLRWRVQRLQERAVHRVDVTVVQPTAKLRKDHPARARSSAGKPPKVRSTCAAPPPSTCPSSTPPSLYQTLVAAHSSQNLHRRVFLPHPPFTIAARSASPHLLSTGCHTSLLYQV